MSEIKTLLMTCSACPVQIEGELTDGRPFYFRYRYAVATLAAGDDCDGRTRGPGVIVREFSDRHEMDGSLDALEAAELLASMAAELPDHTPYGGGS